MMLKVLRMTLVVGLNDERSITSSKKHTYTTRVQNPHPVWDQNGQNWNSISDQNFLKNHTLWGWTYLYSRYEGVPRPLNT